MEAVQKYYRQKGVIEVNDKYYDRISEEDISMI